MRLKVRRTVMQEVDVGAVVLQLPVRYGTEDMGNDFPGRCGDVWWALIDLRDDGTAYLRYWPEKRGRCELQMKVTDGGIYKLLGPGPDGVFIACLAYEYVPHGVVPGRYGDYVHLDIQPDGRIANWPRQMDIQAFFPPEE